jgi:hypothetical protein
VVLFLRDKAQAHGTLATQKKLACLAFHYFDHPPYSLGLAPSDYYLFPGLKKQLKVRHFSSNAKFIPAAVTWLDEKYSEILSGLQELEQWSRSLLRFVWSTMNKSGVWSL